MDQAELLTLVGSMYDKLVNDVAQRVTAKLDERMNDWARSSTILEDRINGTVQDYVDNRVDLDDAIQSWMNNNLEDELTSAMQDFIRNSVTINIDTI